MKPIDLKISREKSEPIESSLYPSFHIESNEEYDFPKSGSMTIDFKKTGETSSTDSSGKDHNSCTIEVRRITDISKSSPDKVSTEDMDEKDESDDYETPKTKPGYEKSSNAERSDKKRATRKPESMY
jgi:hypothetical protein